MNTGYKYIFWAWVVEIYVVLINNCGFLTKFFCLHFVLVAVQEGIGSSNFGSLQLLGAAATSLSHCLWFIDPSTSFGCLQQLPPAAAATARGVTKGPGHKCVFYKRTIKVCVSCSWWCPWTSMLSAAHLSWSLFLSSSRSNARGEGPWRRSVS